MPVRRCLLAVLCASALIPAAAQAREVLSIRQSSDTETITLDPGAITPNKVFTLDNPDRLVVDVPAFSGAGVGLPSSYRPGLINKLRTGRFNASTTRIVFDLNKKIAVQDKQERSGKLTFAITPADGSKPDRSSSSADTGPSLGFLFNNKLEKPQTEPAKPGKDKIDTSVPDKPEPKPAAEKADKKAKPDKKPKAEQPKPEPKPEPAPEEKPKKAKAKTAADLGKQKPKNAKPVIVIDPGHGGIDPGTSGASGAVEKMVVLEYAQALRTRLQKSGHYQVVLTRDRDQFIMLRKRVEIARKAEGDIFISLHADSAPGAARGLSVYTVSEKASDDEAEKLAARENKADVLAGINLEGEREDVAGILISLAERDTKNRSATLADTLVTSLDDKVHLLPDSHRFAGFAVLKAPDIPSVLIEIGFLSHPQEEKLIKSKAYRDKVINGIASGVDDYFKKERQLQE